MKKLVLKPLKAFNDNIWVNWVIFEATLYLCYLCLVYCYCYCLVAILVANYFVTPWTVTCQTPLPTSFPRQEYWSGLPFPSPGDLPDPGIEPCLPHCRQTLYHLSHQGSPPYINTLYILSLLNSRPDTIIGTDNMFFKMYKCHINCGTYIFKAKWYNLFSHFSWVWCCKNYSIISCILVATVEVCIFSTYLLNQFNLIKFTVIFNWNFAVELENKIVL